LPTSSELAVRCDGLGKSYLIGEELSLQHTLRTLVRRAKTSEGFWALKDVTFQVERGDFFGIVGSNGSGKSTLTQIISGIGVPTAGRVRVWGRVLPLLEVGTGFHPDLTGRENIDLLGTVLGLSAQEIDAEVPRIVEFSGIGRHLATPLKRYSSGMQARLSFATAVCFPADTYVFDEVLAVVDDDFRDKCADELRRLHDAGRTVIFMSHDLDLVRRLCTSGMWLEAGHVREQGSMEHVAAIYEQSRHEPVAAAVS
jgi:ABC-type polysaccharide/polyol phosphate transport system ATPase subunit